MSLKKMNKLISRIPVSIRVTAWFTTFILILFVIIMSSAILIEDKIVNNLSAKELVKAVERIYEDPDEFENFEKFNLAIPKELAGVETKLLNPVNTWENKDEYVATRDKLASMFESNFKRYEDVKEGVEYAKAGPTA